MHDVECGYVNSTVAIFVTGDTPPTLDLFSSAYLRTLHFSACNLGFPGQITYSVQHT